MPGNLRTNMRPEGANLRVQIEPTQPVDVYLLLSEWQPAPDWLLRDYEQTPWEVGVALSATRVDAYAIWKFKRPVDSPTVIGQAVDKSMYIPVIVPHDPTGSKQTP